MPNNTKAMEEPDLPYPITRYSGKTKWIMLIGATLVVTASIWGILSLQKQKEVKVTEAKSIVKVEYKQLANSPSLKPTKAKKDVTINILNGTGVTGQAGAILQALVESGYSLSNIKLGNAEEFGHVGTTITSNADLETIVIHIKEAVKSVYPEIVDGVPNNDPNIDTGYDVTIITGSNKVINNKTLTTESITPPIEAKNR